MPKEKTLWAAILLSAAVHAAALTAGWATHAPARTADGEWACAFTVGSISTASAADPSSAAFSPPSTAEAGGRAAPSAGEGAGSGEATLASLPPAGEDGRSALPGGGGSDEYLSMIRRRIAERKRFPAEALNEGRRGTALVAFRILPDGAVSGVRVVRSTSSPILDAEAGMTVRRAAPFPPAPARLDRAPLELRVPISFEIERR